MPTLSDDPVHQHTTQGQKQHPRPNKSGGNEEIAAFAYLKPSRFRKRDVSRQEHQCEQRGDDNIKHLADRFCQTLRRLCYQSFWKSHSFFLEIRGKDRKFCWFCFFQKKYYFCAV